VYTVLTVNPGGGGGVELAALALVVVVGFSVAVTGQTVVYKSTISVVTLPLAGQLVTVGAHDVMV